MSGALDGAGPRGGATSVLSADDAARYSRQLRVIGAEGQSALSQARVLLIGAGGLGSPALLYLAGAGVGTIGVVDADRVEASNLHRQVVHTFERIGEPKVASAALAAAALNPAVAVVRHEARFTADSALELARGYDLVIDGSDNFATRYVASDACEILGIPHVWGSVLRFEGQLSVFHSGHGPTYRDVFPAAPPPGSVPSCAEAGVLGVVPGIIGTAMAAEALKLILGTGEPLIGRLATYDALGARWEEIAVRPDPLREPVRTMIDAASRPEAAPASQADAAPSDPATAVTSEIRVDELAAALKSSRPLLLLDVREPWEALLAALPDALLVPLDELRSRLQAGWRPNPEPIVVYCASGARSAAAADLLASFEVPARSLAGGIAAWQESGRAVLEGAVGGAGPTGSRGGPRRSGHGEGGRKAQAPSGTGDHAAPAHPRPSDRGVASWRG